HVLLLFGALLACFRASLTPFLATGDTPLCLLQCLLGCAKVPRVGDGVPVRREKKDREAHVDAVSRPLSGRGAVGTRHTRERDRAPIRCFAERDGLAGALEGPTPPHGNAPDLAQDEGAVVETGAVALRLVGERVGAVLAVEAGKPRLLAVVDAAEAG